MSWRKPGVFYCFWAQLCVCKRRKFYSLSLLMVKKLWVFTADTDLTGWRISTLQQAALIHSEHHSIITCKHVRSFRAAASETLPPPPRGLPASAAGLRCGVSVRKQIKHCPNIAARWLSERSEASGSQLSASVRAEQDRLLQEDICWLQGCSTGQDRCQSWELQVPHTHTHRGEHATEALRDKRERVGLFLTLIQTVSSPVFVTGGRSS